MTRDGLTDIIVVRDGLLQYWPTGATAGGVRG